MRHNLLAATAVLAVTACASDGTATVTPAPSPTTVATSAPTSTPPTATQPTTTAPRATTNAPPTTAPAIASPTTAPTGSPAEVAVAEVTTRLDAFWAEMDRCFEAPDACDANVIIAEYADPTTPIATWFAAWVNEYADRGQRIIRSDQISRVLVSAVPTPDGTKVLTTQCIVNKAIGVNGPPEDSIVVDDSVGYSRAVMGWEAADDGWTVTGSEFVKLDENGDQTCDFG